MNLQLSLKEKWFKMTKSGFKPEDYREINSYWLKRLFTGFDDSDTQEIIDEIVLELSNFEYSLGDVKFWAGIEPKVFDCNIMTLGYPKSTDSDRILKLEHKGIEIRKGNPEWGAEPDKRYFVIKHGKILN